MFLTVMFFAEMGGWSEYGIVGLVIGALFAHLVIFSKWILNHTDNQAKSHRDERTEWRIEHLKERSESQERYMQERSELSNCIRECSEAISKSSCRYRE